MSDWRYEAGALAVRLKPLPDACWVVKRWDGVPTATQLQQKALATALAHMLSENETIMVDKHRSEDVLNWLFTYGFSTQRLKFLYEKDLTLGVDLSERDTALLRFCSLQDLGEAAFLDYLVLAEKDDPDASAYLDPNKEFQELLEHAGPAFSPENWYVVFESQQSFGVVLPQVFYDKPEEGTLSYFGIMPDQRQKGLGTLLHKWGLQQLKQRGVKRYIGSTGQHNLAMKKVFEKNGCQQIATRHFLAFKTV